MDWTSIGTAVLGFILSIGAVSAFLVKVLPKITKYIVIAKDSINLLDDVVSSLKDGKIDASEIAEIEKHIGEIKADLKA